MKAPIHSLRASDSRRTVLVVDDIEDNCVLLQRALTSGGYLPVVATRGREALSIISVNKPDLVLLDWMMPELTGLETLIAIREIYDSVRLPVIMCTALGEDSSVIQALQAGANDYIVKPVNLPILKARMALHLKQQAIVGTIDDEMASVEQRFRDQARASLARDRFAT
jgi:DNA-binding response OmpR family regulator